MNEERQSEGERTEGGKEGGVRPEFVSLESVDV